MNKKIIKIQKIWHGHFGNKEHQYSEFESSDIEYFIGCLLYNHFAFNKALNTMKTIDLSYDFLRECGDEYDEINDLIKSIEIEDESEKIKFLQDFIADSKTKYSTDEVYLLNRLEYHVNGIATRNEAGADAQHVDFQNPLYR